MFDCMRKIGFFFEGRWIYPMLLLFRKYLVRLKIDAITSSALQYAILRQPPNRALILLNIFLVIAFKVRITLWPALRAMASDNEMLAP